MSTFTNTDERAQELSPGAVVGRTAVVGVLAGVLFGAMIQFGLGRMTAIGAMYTLGEPSLTVGWGAHIFHSALFAAFYGLAADTNVLRERASALPTGVALGAVYATGLWLVNIVIVWPLWLNQVGFGAQLPFPNVAVMPLVGHLLWGVLLGAGTALALSRSG